MKPLTLVSTYRKDRYKGLTWRQIKSQYGFSISKMEGKYYIIADDPQKIQVVYDDFAYYVYKCYEEVSCPKHSYHIMEKLDALTGNHWFYQELTFAE